jgi:hypothetical protein
MRCEQQPCRSHSHSWALLRAWAVFAFAITVILILGLRPVQVERNKGVPVVQCVDYAAR